VKDAADQERLRAEANRLHVEFRTRRHLPFRYPTLKLFESGTGGWSVKIATWKEHPGIELWLDKYISRVRRHFWIGFVSDKIPAIQYLEQSAPPHYRFKRRYTEKDLRTVGNFDVLSHPPTDKEITRPIFETYPGEAYYGMYDKGNHGSDSADELDVFRATNFIQAVAESQGALVDYTASEGGRRHLLVEMSLRDAKIARLRKAHDEFRCQVCGFKFIEQYGEYGEGFAECHHLEPFENNQESRETTLNDLRTVCSNCHRMLHQMEGCGEADIIALKGLVKLPWLKIK